MTILHNEKNMACFWRYEHSQIMFKCVKTFDSRVRGLVGSINRERRGVAETDITYVEPSAVGIHNENSNDIWSIYTYSLTHGLCYDELVQRLSCYLTFAVNMYVKVFSAFEIRHFAE